MIEIFGVRNDRRTKLGTLRLAQDGTVRLMSDLDDSLVRFLTRYRCFRNGERLTIADGEPWFRALPVNLHGTMIWAEETTD